MASKNGKMANIAFTNGKSIITPIGDISDFCEVPLRRIQVISQATEGEICFVLPDGYDAQTCVLKEILPHPQNQWTRP